MNSLAEPRPRSWWLRADSPGSGPPRRDSTAAPETARDHRTTVTEPGGSVPGPLARMPHQPQVPGGAGQGRHLAAAAYRAAAVTGYLSAAEILLAEAQRACPGAEPSAETALATAFVLLHGDGDVAAAHRLLLRAVPTARAGDAGPFGLAAVLAALVTVCQVSGRAEHWKSLRRLVRGPGPVVPAGLHATVAAALDARAAAKRLAGETGALADQADPARIVATASAAVRVGRPVITRRRCGPSGRRATSTGTWATGWARPTCSPRSGTCCG